MMTHPYKRGFTLVETLVAITILMIAIVGPYYSVQQAIMVSATARDQLIASSLAQEGVEYLYFMRDNNYLQGNTWLYGMDACSGTYGCTVDPTQGTPLATCGAGGCPVLRLSSTGLYTQNQSYPVTRFTRTVQVQAVSADQAKVTVNVTWSTSHQDFHITIVENLYNWL